MDWHWPDIVAGTIVIGVVGDIFPVAVFVCRFDLQGVFDKLYQRRGLLEQEVCVRQGSNSLKTIRFRIAVSRVVGLLSRPHGSLE